MCLNAPKWDWSDQVMLLFGAWAGCYRDPRFTVRLRHRFFATKLPNQVRDRRGFEMRAFAYALLHFPSSLRLVLSHAFSFHVGNILFIIWCWWCLLTKMRKSACLNLFRSSFSEQLCGRHVLGLPKECLSIYLHCNSREWSKNFEFVPKYRFSNTVKIHWMCVSAVERRRSKKKKWNGQDFQLTLRFKHNSLRPNWKTKFQKEKQQKFSSRPAILIKCRRKSVGCLGLTCYSWKFNTSFNFV